MSESDRHSRIVSFEPQYDDIERRVMLHMAGLDGLASRVVDQFYKATMTDDGTPLFKLLMNDGSGMTLTARQLHNIVLDALVEVSHV